METETAIKGYEVPSTEGLSPEQAVPVIEKMEADSIGDKNHPLRNSHHPQYQRFTDTRTRLYEIKNQNYVDPLEKQAQEYFEVEKPQAQARLVADAQRLKTEMGSTVKVPADLKDWGHDLIKLEHLVHFGNYAEFHGTTSHILNNVFHAPIDIRSELDSIVETTQELTLTGARMTEEIKGRLRGRARHVLEWMQEQYELRDKKAQMAKTQAGLGGY